MDGQRSEVVSRALKHVRIPIAHNHPIEVSSRRVVSRGDLVCRPEFSQQSIDSVGTFCIRGVSQTAEAVQR